VEVRFQVNSLLPEITVAASAQNIAAPDLAAEQTPAGTSTHHYRAENVRSFALSASHQYQVFRQELEGITLLSYTFPYHAAAGERALDVTAQSVELYQELFGPYPHPVLSVVEADFLDGMEYDGLFFLSNGFYNLYAGSPAEYLTAIAAHETAHQWWYGIVGNDQAYEPWLDEALSTYCERLYYERYYPEALDWWWTYRVNYYQPTGWINTTIYNPEGSTAPYQYYRNAVYLNGALFFEDLRALIGDQAFFAFLKSYASENRGKIVTQEVFFQLLDQYTSQDISGLIQKYFKFN
jgi:aminopeptidase N